MSKLSSVRPRPTKTIMLYFRKPNSGPSTELIKPFFHFIVYLSVIFKETVGNSWVILYAIFRATNIIRITQMGPYKI